MNLSLRGLSMKQYLLIGAGVAVLAGVLFFYQQIDIEAIHARADSVNGIVVFGAMVILPLAGFPVSVIHAVAGLRFGLGLGCLLVALATTLQLLAAYGLVKWMPGFFARKLEPLRKRLPVSAHTPLTLFTMLLPGVPFFSQIYVLPLVGVPLGTFILWSLPISIARSVAGVAFGDVCDHLTPWRLAGFAAYFITVSVVCAWAFRRLRRKIGGDGHKPGQPTPLSEPLGGWTRFYQNPKLRRNRKASE